MSAAARSRAHAVFDELARQGIRYCLWRGSPRLDRAFAGTSDFDLLVAREQAQELAALLLGRDCRRARSTRAEPGLEDYFALGGRAGPLLHFHVHYQLVAGEPRNNRFLLPWARQVLEARVQRTDCSVFVAAPVTECALLLVRCCLQLRWRDRLGGADGRRLAAKVNGDLAVLLPDRDLAPARTLLRDWFGSAVDLPEAAGLPVLPLAELWRLRSSMARALRPLASATGVAAALAGWRAELRAGLRVLARRARLPILPARGGIGGGLLVALEGADQAMRTALADDLHAVFAGKFDVLRLPLRRRQVARSLYARSRGMLVISDTPTTPGGTPSGVTPDMTLTVTTDEPRDELLAGFVQQIWRLL